MPRDLPSGTVTFLFSDIAGSTKLLHELGPVAYAGALMEHRRVMREAFRVNGGVEVDTQGDAFFVAFPTAQGAIRAASQTVSALASGPIRVRIGIHTGTPHLAEEGYVGHDVHKGARIAACGHGGQVLVSASAVALAGSDGMHDLGEHRLKDLSAPERIWQLGTVEFPPLKSLFHTNLPLAPTPFIGRQRELGEVVALLSQDGARVVTLTGPGGTGKTRLAMQAAAELSSCYPQGIWWVPLDALWQSDLVLETAAQAIGAKRGLAEHVGDKAMLILFDNFEQVIDAAAGLAALVASCPKLDLMVTSREPLRLRGEREYAVPPLAHDEGVRLFIDRAREHGRDVLADADVSTICARLDDLPLAIELAAARVKVLSPAQIARRLEQRLPLLTSGARDLPQRQRTLRSAIEWSYELLTPDERWLFARLAVFRGGWTLEAAEAVTDAGLDAVESLVDKSLVRRGDERLSMLETIREYAVERLDASGDAEALRQRHAEHFLALAKVAEPAVLGARPEEWLDRLERDHDNLRAALEWLESAGHTQEVLELAGMLWEFWCLRTHHAEGWRRLERLIALDERPTAARAKALTGAAHLIGGTDAGSEAQMKRAEQALALQREVGDAWGIAFAEYEYARRLNEDGDFTQARPLLDQSVERFRDVGDEHHELQAMRMLAWAHEELGDAGRHRAIHEEVLRRARSIGDAGNTWWSLSNLAGIATTEGRHRDALTLLGQAFRVGRDFGDPGKLVMNLVRFGRALALAERYYAAASVLAAADAAHEKLGWAYPGWSVKQREDSMARARAGLDEPAFARAWDEGRTLTPEQAAALAAGALDDAAS